jgi:uncharacterized membrane protein YfcA
MEDSESMRQGNRQYIGGMTILYILIGMAAGVLAGLFGIGGGVIIVPALLYAARMSQLTATGTSLGALLLPVGALGAWEYYRTGNLDVRAALVIAVGLFVGAFFGAKLAHVLTAIQLRRAFAVFLVLIAIKIWMSK